MEKNIQSQIEPRVNIQPEDVEWTPPPEDPLNMFDGDSYTDPFDIVRMYG